MNNAKESTTPIGEIDEDSEQKKQFKFTNNQNVLYVPRERVLGNRME